MNETTQFFHDKHHNQTFAVDVDFTKEELIHLLTQPQEVQRLNVRVGQSFVHPNDNYCKKTGREVSTERLKQRRLYLCGMYMEDDRRLYFIFNDKEFLYRFRVSPNSKRVHLLEVSEYYEF